MGNSIKEKAIFIDRNAFWKLSDWALMGHPVKEKAGSKAVALLVRQKRFPQSQTVFNQTSSKKIAAKPIKHYWMRSNNCGFKQMADSWQPRTQGDNLFDVIDGA